MYITIWLRHNKFDLTCFERLEDDMRTIFMTRVSIRKEMLELESKERELLVKMINKERNKAQVPLVLSGTTLEKVKYMVM